MQIRSIQLRSRPLESPGATWWRRWSVHLRGRDPRPSPPLSGQIHPFSGDAAATIAHGQVQARAEETRQAALDEQLRGPGRRRF